jgi:hypothetical protein
LFFVQLCNIRNFVILFHVHSAVLQRLRATVPSQPTQAPKIEKIAELLSSAPAMTHGGSIVIHRSKKWALALAAVLHELPASSGHALCGLCRSDSYIQLILKVLRIYIAAGNLGYQFSPMLPLKIPGGV